MLNLFRWLENCFLKHRFFTTKSTIGISCYFASFAESLLLYFIWYNDTFIHVQMPVVLALVAMFVMVLKVVTWLPVPGRPGAKLIISLGWCPPPYDYYINLVLISIMSHRWTAGLLWYRLSLTHWGRDKMAAISQTIFSNAFSWMKMFEFWLKFHWSLFLRVQLIIFQHWFR